MDECGRVSGGYIILRGPLRTRYEYSTVKRTGNVYYDNRYSHLQLDTPLDLLILSVDRKTFPSHLQICGLMLRRSLQNNEAFERIGFYWGPIPAYRKNDQFEYFQVEELEMQTVRII